LKFYENKYIGLKCVVVFLDGKHHTKIEQMMMIYDKNSNYVELRVGIINHIFSYLYVKIKRKTLKK